MQEPSLSETFGDTAADVTRFLSLKRAAEEARDAVLFSAEEGELSYAEFWAQTEPYVERVRGERLVALVARPSLSPLSWLYACLECGTPALLLHPAWPEERLREACAEVGASALATGAELVPLARGPDLARAAPPPLFSEDQLLLFTSGTAGGPKIVVHSRRSLSEAALLSEANLPVLPSDRWQLHLTFAHVGGLSVLIRSLGARSTVVLPGSRLGRPTLLSLVPTQLSAHVQAQEAPGESVRAVLVGGAPAPPALRRHARELGWPLLCTYGMTEMGSQIATQSPADLPRLQASGEEERDVGAPLGRTEVRVEPSGNLLVRGPSRMRGYLGEPPLPPSAWLSTGDTGSFNDSGHLCVTGRADDMLITGGENVQPVHVENVLRDLLGTECCVVGVPDEKWGHKLVALVAGGPGTPPPDQVLQEHDLRFLPRYAVPKVWLRIEELPKNPLGKLDRREALRIALSLLV